MISMDAGSMSLGPATFPYLGFGVGLRKEHFHSILHQHPTQPLSIDWFEAISENFMSYGHVDARERQNTLAKIRERYPIVLHGVSLSVGGTDPLNQEYLHSLKDLAQNIQASWVSDHLCWGTENGRVLHELMPLPYTEEVLVHTVSRIQKVQEFLGRRLMLENVSSYIEFVESEMQEWEFLSEVARRSGCAILLDINNIFVSATNHGFSPHEYLRGVPLSHVAQLHLAGPEDNGDFLVDTHDHPVRDEVWELYQEFLKMAPAPVSTLLEWDASIPEVQRLVEELDHARKFT